MVVGIGMLSIAFDRCRSLKDKRRVLKPLIHRIQSRHCASVAEVGDYELWGNACLGIAIVSTSISFVEKAFQDIENEAASTPEIEIREFWREIERR